MTNIKYDLIVTIVNKGDSLEVINAAKTSGASGATIINGRGLGFHETAKIFGIPIEPEKDIVLTIVDKTTTKEVLANIIKEGKLNHPGQGIAFVLDVEEVKGFN